MIQILSKHDKFYAVLNDSNHNAWTSLHLAAHEGNCGVLEILLKKGAFLLKDLEGRTPLHLASQMGHREVNTPLHYTALNNQPKVTKLLLRLNCQLTYNNDGYSAIDLALVNKFIEVTFIMVTEKYRGDEVLGLSKGKHPCIMEALVAKMPAIAKAVFDKEIRKSTEEKPNSPSYHASHIKLSGIFSDATNDLQREWGFYVRYNWFDEPRDSLHPNGASCLAQEFIDMTLFREFKRDSAYDRYKMKNASENMPEILVVVSFIIGFSTIFNLLLEGVNIVRHGFEYCRNIDTWVWITMNVCCLVATYHHLIDALFPRSGAINWEWVNLSFALACFMGWFYLLLIMQRFEAVGLYVSMFVEIVKTLLRVLIVFSILIIAFALAFFVLLSNGNHEVFSKIRMSVMRTFSMMLGDLDFMNTFVYPHHCEEMEKNNRTNIRLYTNFPKCKQSRRTPEPYAAFSLVGVYMIFMPIAMINLLIGLAVGDIGLVRKNAQLKRLSMQVQIHTNIEKSLPKFILAKLNESSHSVVEYPNRTIKSMVERLAECFLHKDKKAEDENNVKTESDDLMEAILDNSATLEKLTSDMENIRTWAQHICTTLKIKSDLNQGDETQFEDLN
ncbi:unnamed protein product [Allacma fusca]|uniref:Ion transport domain-containing protein n=1 Tax=Allacma fusca TaxID=39272 RepID=A0A8J2P0P8_9HEXA|nr:unnamed protein product [Allacma fusca]